MDSQDPGLMSTARPIGVVEDMKLAGIIVVVDRDHTW
jgi:hypothetical protein